MIAKGNLHRNGTKLASYLVTGHRGEIAELVLLRGFASSDQIRQQRFGWKSCGASAPRRKQDFFIAMSGLLPAND